MAEPKEFIDLSFRPRISIDDEDKFYDLFSRAKMNMTGTPAPTLTDGKAAIWYGKRANRNGEIPVLSVLVGRDSDNITFGAHWFIGVISTEMLRPELLPTDSVAPLQAVINASAEYGAGTESFRALSLLANFYIPGYKQPPTRVRPVPSVPLNSIPPERTAAAIALPSAGGLAINA